MTVVDANTKSGINLLSDEELDVIFAGMTNYFTFGPLCLEVRSFPNAEGNYTSWVPRIAD
jgi:hypothetical protein